MKAKKPLIKFTCSYAQDIACFADFVVEARSERAAQRIINAALKAGKFETVETTPCWENGTTNERVFVQGEATDETVTTTLEDLIGREHVFSPTTHLCHHCGIHADDDLLENQPCRPVTS
jgi:hypothetical protein